jgi:pyruvate dehydrogenase E1 component beta subunit
VTIVGVSRMALTAERAAEQLTAEHGIEAEVIDPRTLRPLDLDTILESVAKTNRCVVVEEGWPHGGVGANLAALVSEQAFDDLDAPVLRVSGADVPMPYSKPLEEIAYPHEPDVVRAVLSVLGRNPAQAPTTRPASAHDGQREGEKDAPGAVQEAMQQAGVESEIREASR